MTLCISQEDSNFICEMDFSSMLELRLIVNDLP